MMFAAILAPSNNKSCRITKQLFASPVRSLAASFSTKRKRTFLGSDAYDPDAITDMLSGVKPHTHATDVKNWRKRIVEDGPSQQELEEKFGEEMWDFVNSVRQELEEEQKKPLWGDLDLEEFGDSVKDRKEQQLKQQQQLQARIQATRKQLQQKKNYNDEDDDDYEIQYNKAKNREEDAEEEEEEEEEEDYEDAFTNKKKSNTTATTDPFENNEYIPPPRRR